MCDHDLDTTFDNYQAITLESPMFIRLGLQGPACITKASVIRAPYELKKTIPCGRGPRCLRSTKCHTQSVRGLHWLWWQRWLWRLWWLWWLGWLWRLWWPHWRVLWVYEIMATKWHINRTHSGQVRRAVCRSAGSVPANIGIIRMSSSPYLVYTLGGVTDCISTDANVLHMVWSLCSKWFREHVNWWQSHADGHPVWYLDTLWHMGRK